MTQTSSNLGRNPNKSEYLKMMIIIVVDIIIRTELPEFKVIVEVEFLAHSGL